MEQNIFEAFQARKSIVKNLATKGVNFGWISQADADQISRKLDNDILTIGVIGQMKAGKSTFLNSFIFQEDVLPSATTPMTAALSVITYGPEKKLEVEFYTTDEWAEQQITAQRDLREVANNPLEESKVKAAKELVEKASKLGASLNSYLGKSQSDRFENLEEYVGADGKYVSITKSVKIYYPNEMLKGVEIVDTPGFNDPIVSREERTKDFLKRADAVVVLLYAGQPLSATDRDILFKNVRQCGIGKVLIGINKYDIPFCNGEVESEIVAYVKEELKKACKESNDYEFNTIIKEVEPVALSSEMALLSQLPMQKIQASDIYSSAWKRHCDNFEISSQMQLLEKSHIQELISIVKNTIDTQKGEILFRKPVMQIINAGKNKLEELEKQRTQCSNDIKVLSVSDNDLDEKLESLDRAERRLNKKIDGLSDDIEAVFRDIIKKGLHELEDATDATRRRMESIIEGLRRFSSDDSIVPSLDRETQQLLNRTLPRSLESINNDIERKTKNTVDDFFVDVTELCERYLEDFDYQDSVHNVQSRIVSDIETGNFIQEEDDDSVEEKPGFLRSVGDFLLCINPAFWIGCGIGHILSLQERKNAFYEGLNSFFNQIDFSEPLNRVMRNRDIIINNIREALVDNLIHPIKEQIEDIKNNTADREKQLSEKQDLLKRLEGQKKELIFQLKEAETMV